VHHERAAARDRKLHMDSDRLSVPIRRADWDVARALHGDEHDNFNNADVRKALRTLRLGDRMHCCAFPLACHSEHATVSFSNVGVQFAFFPWKSLYLIALPSLSSSAPLKSTQVGMLPAELGM
jgi:hypothetical protein